jgi:sulfur-oxidizing protein SoxX
MRIRRALAVVLLGALYFPLAFSQSIEQGVIVQSLTDVPGDPVRGRAIVTSRQTGLCLLCHSGPFPEERFQGNLAPELASSVGRYSAAQLRARIVDASYFNANTIMPAYFRTNHLHRVASKFAGQTILNGQEIEDVVAFLLTLNSGVQ